MSNKQHSRRALPGNAGSSAEPQRRGGKKADQVEAIVARADADIEAGRVHGPFKSWANLTRSLRKHDG